MFLPDPHERSLAGEATAPRPPLKLGVLELCHVPDGRTDQEVLFEAFELAAHADELGFSRFWLGEHHGGETAHACPELLAALVGQLTQHIRVGTACVLLNYYRPLKVAKTFRLLHSLFPGRIDLGVGAGRVGPAVAAALLGGHHDVEEQPYADKVAELAGWLRQPRLPVTPRSPGNPELWVLGSSGLGSASVAAEHGAAFSYSLFLQQSRTDAAAIRHYRDSFRYDGLLPTPRWNIAVAGVCAETEAEALRIRARHKNPFIVPTIVGTPDQCRHRLEQLRDSYETDEIIFLDISTELDERVRSLRLLAEAIGLEPPGNRTARQAQGAGRESPPVVRALCTN